MTLQARLGSLCSGRPGSEINGGDSDNGPEGEETSVGPVRVRSACTGRMFFFFFPIPYTTKNKGGKKLILEFEREKKNACSVEGAARSTL